LPFTAHPPSKGGRRPPGRRGPGRVPHLEPSTLDLRNRSDLPPSTSCCMPAGRARLTSFLRARLAEHLPDHRRASQSQRRPSSFSRRPARVAADHRPRGSVRPSFAGRSGSSVRDMMVNKQRPFAGADFTEQRRLETRRWGPHLLPAWMRVYLETNIPRREAKQTDAAGRSQPRKRQKKMKIDCAKYKKRQDRPQTAARSPRRSRLLPSLHVAIADLGALKLTFAAARSNRQHSFLRWVSCKTSIWSSCGLNQTNAPRSGAEMIDAAPNGNHADRSRESPLDVTDEVHAEPADLVEETSEIRLSGAVSMARHLLP
jgi:hypothetical protein